MMKFKVLAQYDVELETTIEADSLEEAWDKARDLDGSEFTEVNKDGWRIYDVTEE
jgi:hypothetical protein